MSSNCDSDGCPIDQDGAKLEDCGGFTSGVQFAVRSDVLHEILSGSGKDVEGKHIDVDFLEAPWVRPSALGGIPVVERVEIEDVEDGFSSDGVASPKSVSGNHEMSSTVQTILRTSKHERDELYSARRKLGDVFGFLRKQGFSEEQVLADLKREGFGTTLPSRDENGLPLLNPVPNPLKDKMKSKMDDVQSSAQKVFEENPKPVVKSEEEKPPGSDAKSEKSKPKPWADVVKIDVPELKFNYYLKAKGVSLLEPPDEVLKKGNDKYKFCVVGTFSKGTLTYKLVSEFAFKF